MVYRYDFLVIGSGIAGMSFALKMADKGKVALVCKTNLEEANTYFAQGGIASIGQLQFLQPFLGLAFAAAILGESIGWSLLVVMVLVIGCVAAARRFA